MTRFGFVNNVLMAVVTNPTEDEADALHKAGFSFVQSEIWNGLVKGLYIYIYRRTLIGVFVRRLIVQIKEV